MTSSRSRSRVRRSIVTVAGLAAIAGAAVAVSHRSPDESAAPTSTVPNTAAASVGDLTTTVTLDGSVELSDTTVVVHRIEGATPSSSSSSSNSAGNGATVPSVAGGGVPQAVSNADCTGTPATATPSPPPSVDPAATTTTPPAVVSAPSTSSTDAPVPTTTVEPQPVDPGVTTTTACPTTPSSVDATTTTVASPNAPVGGIPPGGGVGSGAPTGAAAAGGSSPSSTVETQLLTSVVAAGTAVSLGDVMYTVDGNPVVALHGALPAWRTLSTASADGPDVAQLEQSLVDLGYDPDGDLTVDDEFDSVTKKVVKQWQKGLGLEATGEVTLGSVVFLPVDASVASVTAAVGVEIADGDVVLELAGATQQVVVTVPEEHRQLVVPGATVSIGDVAGTVTLLRSADQDGTVSVEAVVAPSTPIPAAIGGTSVTVKITTTDATDVVLVPVQAVASRLDGSYALQVADGSAVRWVTIEVVGQSGTKVGVVGEGVTDGTTIVVPKPSS